MIKLPKDWEKGVLFRGWMKPINQLSEISVLVLILVNDDEQTWAYEHAAVLSLAEALVSHKSLDDLKKEKLDEAYETLLHDLPIAAAEDENETKNDNWRVLDGAAIGLVPVDQVREEKK